MVSQAEMVLSCILSAVVGFTIASILAAMEKGEKDRARVREHEAETDRLKDRIETLNGHIRGLLEKAGRHEKEAADAEHLLGSIRALLAIDEPADD